MLAFMISPERGSLRRGPYAFSIVDGSQRIAELRASSRSKFGSAVGATLAVIALLNPAARNTGSHISTPLIRDGGVRVLRLQAVALDEAAPRARDAVLVVVLKREVEVAHAIVAQPRHHR